jgi:hypothetical protein
MRALVLTACLAAVGAAANAQGTIALTIASPAENTVVAPGATVDVSVEARTGATLAGPIVIVSPLGTWDSSQPSLPAPIRITIPRRVASGRYPITAAGSSEVGARVSSKSVTIAVERDVMPASITTNMPKIHFSKKEDDSPIQLVATFRDGTTAAVERSTLVR